MKKVICQQSEDFSNEEIEVINDHDLDSVVGAYSNSDCAQIAISGSRGCVAEAAAAQ